MKIRVTNKTLPFHKAFAKGIFLGQSKKCVPDLPIGRPFRPICMFMMSFQWDTTMTSEHRNSATFCACHVPRYTKMVPTSHETIGVRRSHDRLVYGIGQRDPATVIVTQSDNKLFSWDCWRDKSEALLYYKQGNGDCHKVQCVVVNILWVVVVWTNPNLFLFWEDGLARWLLDYLCSRLPWYKLW